MTEERPQQRTAYLKHDLQSPSAAHIVGQLQLLRRYDPLLLTLAGAEAADSPLAVRSLASLHPLAQAGNRLAYRLTRSCPFWERELRRHGCRLIHAHSGREGLIGLRLGARLRLPLVTSFRGADLAGQPRRFEPLFARGALFLADAEAVRRQLLSLGCPEERLRVLHPGVDVERIPFAERQPCAESVNVLLIGRLVERKGIVHALQAFAHASLYHRRATLTVIGDGPERPKVEALLHELNLANVRLLGAQPHQAVLDEMQEAHILIQPNVTGADGGGEGIPLALLEAQASGLPVVATWHSGLPEVVADGRSGYLVSERDTHALGERLRHLIEHPELWGPFGRAGREVVAAGFDLQQQALALEGYYDQLLAGA